MGQNSARLCAEVPFLCRTPSRLCSEPLLPLRLAGAGGRKKVFRLSDVVKPLSDVQVEKLKLGAVTRILRAERAVACSGAAQVRHPPS